MDNIGLYLVTDRRFLDGRSLEDVVVRAVEGGVRTVQLREKDISTREFIEEALSLKKVLRRYDVPLIVNDRVDVALAADADGVHLGQSDMPYAAARKLLGKEKIIGLSVENMDQVLESNVLDVDYIGISPVFSTSTKTDTETPFGLEGLKEAVRISRHRAVAIGGINAGNIRDIRMCGADGAAVVSAVMGSADPESAARRLSELFSR